MGATMGATAVESWCYLIQHKILFFGRKLTRAVSTLVNIVVNPRWKLTFNTLSVEPDNILSKVDVHKSNTTTIMTSIFEWYVVDLKNWHQRKHVFKNDRTTSSKCANHSRVNNQHDLGVGWGPI